MDRIDWKKVGIPAILTFFAFSIKLDIPDLSGSVIRCLIINLLGSFRGFSASNAIQLPCIFLLYQFIYNKVGTTEKNGRIIVVQSILFSLFRIFGYSFAKDDSWRLVMGIKNGQILKAFFVALGYYFFFAFIIRFLYFVADEYISKKASATIKQKEKRALPNRISALMLWYSNKLEEKTFLTILCTMLIAYIPYFIVTYPTRFMGDSRCQIIQAFSELKSTGRPYLTPDRLLSDKVYINQHHPVAHTLLIHMCLLLGDTLFKSFNIGIFVYSLFQSFVLLSSVSFAAATIFKKGLQKQKYVIFIMVYSFFHPLIHDYLCLVTKDVIYTAFFIFLTTELYLIIDSIENGNYISSEDQINPRGFLRVRIDKNGVLYFGLIMACLGMLLFRNDSRYILTVLFMTTAVTYRKARKVALIMMGIVVGFSLLIFGVIFPALKYTPGSIREMLSVPFQQTARYVVEYENEITDEEKAVIDTVLDYDVLKDRYNAYEASGVKNTFNEYSNKEDLKKYFAAWFRMLLKHPGVYIQSMMNSYYQYFYMDEVQFNRYSYEYSEVCINRINKSIEPLNRSFHYPEITSRLRAASDAINDSLRTFPVFSFFMSPGVYTCFLIMLLFYGIRENSTGSLVLLMPSLLVILICILGPCSGVYGRYSFPVVVLAPNLLPMFLDIVRRDNQSKTVLCKSGKTFEESV